MSALYTPLILCSKTTTFLNNPLSLKLKKMAEQTHAELAAKNQREISVAEFFEKNRHLLGFDSKRKALLTATKEAVDNSLDACEEARILPEIMVEIIEMGESRFRIIVEDNGPGIVKKQLPNIFAKLLYGSKFHSLKSTRGQQGIGISAAAMYGQLTTGKPIRIKSRISPKHDTNYVELHIDTKNNKPEILVDEVVQWNKNHGTRIELDIEATYQKGAQSVDEYLKQTSIANPHVTIVYTTPKAEQFIFARAVEILPKDPKEIKPHPYGIELGRLIKMLRSTESRTLQAFLTNEFSKVGANTAREICENAALLSNMKPGDLAREQAEQLMKGIEKTKIQNPSTDCIVPIGAEQLEKGLRKEINAEYYFATTRPASVYSGNPFQIEVGCAYGGELTSDDSMRILRFANRVPLLFQQSACAVYKAVLETSWRSYGLQQSRGALPQGPVMIAVNMSSVWVPFTSESKEAIAHYPEILKELKLALQECGRNLARYVGKKRRIGAELKKRGYIEKYLKHVSESLQELIGFKDADKDALESELKELLEQQRGELEDVSFNPEKNEEYDEEFARIGEESDEEQLDDAEDFPDDSPKKKSDKQKTLE